MRILLLVISAKIVSAIESTGGDDVSRCQSHLTRNDYLQTYDGKCYQVITTQKKWFGAKAHCAQQGGDLITIEHQGIQQFIEQSLTDLALDVARLWIGATDTHIEHHWTWVTGENVSDGYTNWQEGSPSCYLPVYLCREDCAVLLLDKGYQWFQTFCSANDWQYGFICQYDMQPESTTSPSSTTATRTTSGKQQFAPRIAAAAAAAGPGMVNDAPVTLPLGAYLPHSTTKRAPPRTTIELNVPTKEAMIDCNSDGHHLGTGILMAVISVLAFLVGIAVGLIAVHLAKRRSHEVVEGHSDGSTQPMLDKR